MLFLKYDLIFQAVVLFSCVVAFGVWLLIDAGFLWVYIFLVGFLGRGFYQLLISNTIHYNSVKNPNIKKSRYRYKVASTVFLLLFVGGYMLIASRFGAEGLNDYIKIIFVSPLFLCSYFWLCFKDWQMRRASQYNSSKLISK
jgi:hypothetical protein